MNLLELLHPARIVERLSAVGLAIAVHVALFAVLVIGVAWQPDRAGRPAEEQPIKAVVVDDRKLREAEAKKTAEARAKKEAEVKAKKEAEAKAKKAAEARAKKAAEAKAKKAAEAKAKKAAEAKAKKAAEAKAKKAAEAKAKKEAEAKAKKAAEAKAKKEAEAKAKKAAEAKAKKEAEARARREEAEAALRHAVQEEEAELSQRQQRLRDKLTAEYIADITGRVTREWIRPPFGASGLRCLVRVRQIPSGDVVSVQVVESSGNVAFDRSVEQAVLQASPLPLPRDRELFAREIVFEFTPED